MADTIAFALCCLAMLRILFWSIEDERAKRRAAAALLDSQRKK